MDNENHTSDATDDDSEDNFAQLLEKSLTTRGRLEPGQKVESKI